MNTFLGILRQLSLGGIVLSVLSLCLGSSFSVQVSIIAVVVFCLLYLLFVLFTWLKINRTIGAVSRQYNQDIPKKNYFSVLIRGLGLDIISPITVIIDLISKKKSNRWILFVSTYIIIVLCVVLWFFVIKKG